MTIRTLILAAAVTVATLATADRADAQWRRYRPVVYPTYSYPAYSYPAYSPGVVVASGFSTPTYVAPSGIVTAGYSTGYTPSYFATPYQSMYYSNIAPVYTAPYGYRPVLFPRRYWGW